LGQGEDQQRIPLKSSERNPKKPPKQIRPVEPVQRDIRKEEIPERKEGQERVSPTSRAHSYWNLKVDLAVEVTYSDGIVTKGVYLGTRIITLDERKPKGK